MITNDRVLSVTPKATGYTHIEVDGGITTRLVLVTPMERAHEVLAADVANMLNRLAYGLPRRGTDLTS